MTVGASRRKLSYADLAALARSVTEFWDPFGIWCQLCVENPSVYVFTFRGDLAQVPTERVRKSIDPAESTIFYIKRLTTEWESLVLEIDYEDPVGAKAVIVLQQKCVSRKQEKTLKSRTSSHQLWLRPKAQNPKRSASAPSAAEKKKCSGTSDGEEARRESISL